MRNGKTYSEAGKMGAIASLNSHHERKNKRIIEYLKNPNRCLFCNNELDYEHRKLIFCNKSCAASFNNKKRKKKNVNKNKCKTIISNKIKHCLNCNTILNNNHSIFCCPQCMQDYNWKLRKIDIEKNGKFKSGKNGEVNRRTVRRYLLEKYGNCCQICKNTEWMGQPIPLIVDHINGNSLDCSIENFRLICGNCDMQLPTYKNRNKFGRAWRRQRYRENKSY